MTEQDKQALIEYYCQRDCGHTREECCLDNCHEIMLIEEFPTTPTDTDTISRQAATDVLDEQIEQCNKSLSSFDISMKDEYAVKVERASLVAFREILEYLPPAQLGTNLAEVGTDCISRQAAIDALRKMQTYKLFSGDDMLLIDQAGAQTELMMLPPSEPERKRGTWILDRSGAYCCSKCMEPCAGYVMMKPRDKFCKMCGSKNEVTE